MHELTARGGRVVIETVTSPASTRSPRPTTSPSSPPAAASSPPCSPATMRAASTASRSAASPWSPSTAPAARDGVPFIAVKNNILEGAGEAVWIPYYHRDVGRCWNLIFEAIPGGPMDVFAGARTGAEALALARRVITTLTPWEAAWARDMRARRRAGLAGRAITPTVRSPVARLPSGRVVTCVGDTAIHFDPLAAQGANNGTKMARHLVAAVAARADAPLDAAWMHATFESFWAAEGHPAFALTNLMLAPMNAAGRLVLIAQYGSDGARRDGRQALADAFAAAFADPPASSPAHRWRRGAPLHRHQVRPVVAAPRARRRPRHRPRAAPPAPRPRAAAPARTPAARTGGVRPRWHETTATAVARLRAPRKPGAGAADRIPWRPLEVR
jgi:hypothetical protein